jgi:hypothetical protein
MPAVPRESDVLVVAGLEDEAHGSGPTPGRPKADLRPLGGQRVHEVTSVGAHVQTFLRSFSPNRPFGLIMSISSTTMYGAVSLKPSGR